MCQLCNIRIQYFMSFNTCNPTLRVDSSVFRSGRCWSSNGIVNVLCKLSDKNQRHSSKTFFVFELCHINILEPEMQTAKQLRKQTKLNVIMWVMREWAVRWALACKFYQTAKGWRRLDDSCNIQVFTQIILIIMIIAKSSTRAFFSAHFFFFRYVQRRLCDTPFILWAFDGWANRIVRMFVKYEARTIQVHEYTVRQPLNRIVDICLCWKCAINN